jgi:hypothetical protein
MQKNTKGGIVFRAILYVLCSCKIEQIPRFLLKFEFKSVVNWNFSLVSKQLDVKNENVQEILKFYSLLVKSIFHNTWGRLGFELEF